MQEEAMVEVTATAVADVPERPPIEVHCVELESKHKSKEYKAFIESILSELLLLGDYIQETISITHSIDLQSGEEVKDPGALSLYMEFDDFPEDGNQWCYPHTLMVYYKLGDKLVYKFKLDKFPACGAIGVSKHVETGEKYRGNGIASRAQIHKTRIAEKLGYATLLCTVMSDNLPQIKTLEKSGWRIFSSFNNIKTGHDVTLFGKDIKPSSNKTFSDLLVDKVKETVLW